jgi:hypothetical protein
MTVKQSNRGGWNLQYSFFDCTAPIIPSYRIILRWITGQEEAQKLLTCGSRIATLRSCFYLKGHVAEVGQSNDVKSLLM